MPLPERDRSFARRVVITILLGGAVALVCYTARLLLLGFAGILGAVILDSAASWVASHSRLERKWAYLGVLLGIICLTGLIAWLLAPRIVVQVSQIASALPAAVNNARGYLNRSDWGRVIAAHLSNAGIQPLVSRVTQMGTMAVKAAIAITVTVVLTMYLAGNPDLYRKGLLSLLPPDWRDASNELLGTAGNALRWWLIGQSVPMIVLGIATMVGLIALHVPLAFTLSLITGLLIFVPFAGAVIAYIFTALVTLSWNPGELVYVTILFVGIHILEGYILTPLVQKRAVYLPPAVTISAQVLMSTLFGVLGLVLATPLAAAVLAVVTRFYVHDGRNRFGPPEISAPRATRR